MLAINNTTNMRLPEKRLQGIYASFCRQFKLRQLEVSLAVVGSRRMQTINHRYRGYNRTTDVLSFPAASGSAGFLGEIVIDKDEAAKVSKYRQMFQEIGLSFSGAQAAKQYLFYFLFVHGLLHLVGYQDKEEKGRLQMLSLGRDFLKRVL